MGLLFAMMTTLLAAHGLGGGEMSAGIKPADQGFAFRQGRGLAREIREDRLRHILREMRVAIHLPQRRRIDQVHVPPHQFGKGILRICFGIPAKQFTIGCHSRSIAPGRAETGQGNDR